MVVGGGGCTWGAGGYNGVRGGPRHGGGGSGDRRGAKGEGERARGERRGRRVDGIAGHYSETRICSFVSSLCMRRGVCASFYRLKSRLRITVQMIFFRVRTRTPASSSCPPTYAAPNRTPSSSSRAPFNPHTYVRERLPTLPMCVHLMSVSVTRWFLLFESSSLFRPDAMFYHRVLCPTTPLQRTRKEFKIGAQARRRR